MQQYKTTLVYPGEEKKYMNDSGVIIDPEDKDTWMFYGEFKVTEFFTYYFFRNSGKREDFLSDIENIFSRTTPTSLAWLCSPS